jgi:hypothetical protein
MKLTEENRSAKGKTCPSATLPTTNPTWSDPGLNQILRGERSATNRLSHGTAYTGVSYHAILSERVVMKCKGVVAC